MRSLYSRAIALMAENMHVPLTVPELCEQLDCTTDMLKQSFKRFADTSPSLYYRNMRLDAVRSNLKTSKHSVTKIRSFWGFDDNNVFKRAYQSRYGVLPEEDRND